MDTLQMLASRDAIFAQVRKLVAADPELGRRPLYELFDGWQIPQRRDIIDAYASLGIPLQPDPGIARGESAWAGWETFSDRQLLETNIAFLRNEIGSTPYHHGPLYMEQAASVPLLVKMHEHGLFTENGQAPINFDIREGNGEVDETMQISYVDFYARDSEELRDFFRLIASYGLRFFFRVAPNVYYCNFLRETITVTAGRAAPTRAALEDTPWELFSRSAVARLATPLEGNPMNAVFSHENGWVWGSVVAPNAVDGVEPYMVRAIENAGMRRVL